MALTLQEAASLVHVKWLDSPATIAVEDAPHIVDLLRGAYNVAAPSVGLDVFGQRMGIFGGAVIRSG